MMSIQLDSRAAAQVVFNLSPRNSKAAFRDGFYAQCCFICQQVGEKAMKAVCIRKRKGLKLTHSISELSRSLRIDSKLLLAASILDQYYVTGRYPNVLPGLAPHAIFRKEQARQAIQFAEQFVKMARGSQRRRR